MKKQTAVDWLLEQIFKHNNLVKGDGWFYVKPDIIEQAKEMEKEQISKFVTINIESATGQDLGKVTYIPLPNIDYVPKQETLEEAAERFSIDIREENYKDGFIEGAKWQQERMYSEAIEFAEWIRIKDFQTTSKDNWIGLDMKYYTTEELFEQFKKVSNEEESNNANVLLCPRADLKFIIFHRPTNTEIQMPVLSICDEYSTVSFSTSENDYEGKYNGINRLPSYVGNNSADDYDVYVEINGVRHLYDGIFYSDYREVRRHGA